MRPRIGKVVGHQAKQIIYNVYNYFKQRKQDPASIEHLNDVNLANLVASITGLSNTTIRNIMRQGKQLCENNGAAVFKSPKKPKDKKRVEIDHITEGIIRRKIIQYYTVKKEIPSLRKINAELKRDGILDCSREYLRQTLHRLGFTYKKCQLKRKLLIERADICSSRWNYLLAIKKYRHEGRPIFYVDETYANQPQTESNSWRQSTNTPGVLTNTGNGPGLNILHAGGRNGFIDNTLLIFEAHSKSGDYHGDMNSNHFEKWLKEKLLPNIPNNSVIVMDNAACHCKQIDKKPSMSATKQAMQEWLTRHQVPYEETMQKCDLIQIINSQRLAKRYMVDEIIIQAGHTVLRIPPYHSDLNPIEMVWADVNDELARNYVHFSLDQKRDALLSLLTNYSNEWKKCDDLVIKNEDTYYENDRIFDEEFDRLVKSLSGNTYDSDGDSEDDSGNEMEFDDSE